MSVASTVTQLTSDDEPSAVHNHPKAFEGAQIPDAFVTISERSSKRPLGMLTQAARRDAIYQRGMGSGLRCYYTLDMVTRQFDSHHSGGYIGETFELLLDTGSNTTWVRGDNVRRIVDGADSASSEFDVERFTEDELRGRSTLINYGHCISVPAGQRVKVKKSDWAHVEYGVSKYTHLLLTQADTPRSFTIQGCFEWGGNPQRSWRVPISFQYPIGVAVAGQPSVALNQHYDGILALGNRKYQGALRTEIDAASARNMNVSSFLVELAAQLRKPVWQPGEASNALVVMYFVLRAPIWKLPSYLAWQSWPGEAVPWSHKIYVNPADGKWTVKLQSLSIWLVADTTLTPEGVPNFWSAVPDATISCFAWEFTLDTGSSLSYFPDHILTEIFQRLGLQSHGKDTSATLPSPYHLPQAVTNPRASGAVRFEFTSFATGTVVPVDTSTYSFLWNDSGEGLIWGANLGRPDLGTPRRPGILGLNFFNVVAAAFHLPKDDYEPPWVTFTATGNMKEFPEPELGS
ncbi:hypothetical protein BD414DRAFT_168568 [Trametes punicea]|nr:hypothetical protein BD414DRAFT_168568 [Trametes punicea]